MIDIDIDIYIYTFKCTYLYKYILYIYTNQSHQHIIPESSTLPRPSRSTSFLLRLRLLGMQQWSQHLLESAWHRNNWEVPGKSQGRWTLPIITWNHYLNIMWGLGMAWWMIKDHCRWFHERTARRLNPLPFLTMSRRSPEILLSKIAKAWQSESVCSQWFCVQKLGMLTLSRNPCYGSYGLIFNKDFGPPGGEVRTQPHRCVMSRSSQPHPHVNILSIL